MKGKYKHKVTLKVLKITAFTVFEIKIDLDLLLSCHHSPKRDSCQMQWLKYTCFGFEQHKNKNRNLWYHNILKYYDFLRHS